MKREIKFRAKAINNDFFEGAWVDGYYTKVLWSGNLVDIITDGAHEIPIQIETLGQFTGLHDKNGQEIYEGDIVQLDYITTTGKHRIGLSFEVKWCTQEGCWVGWDGFTENVLQQTRKMFVVKGNIYDNPDLIKQ
jgi:uncharacterized phage protein (TIGR01671 family)